MGKHYSQLALDERLKLAKWRDAKVSMREIAIRLGRPPCTLYRELRRNRFTDVELPELNGYYGMNAQSMYAIRHKSRGHAPNNLIQPAKRYYALSVTKESYADFGPTLAAEMLAGHHGLTVSREPLRKWTVEDDLWLSRKQRRLLHKPRLRPTISGCPQVENSPPTAAQAKPRVVKAGVSRGN